MSSIEPLKDHGLLFWLANMRTHRDLARRRVAQASSLLLRRMQAGSLRYLARQDKRPWLKDSPKIAALKASFTAATFLAATSLGAATIEGRVTLSKARATPVVNQRYEIVASAGVLSTNPPVAVVYLAGSFPQPAGQAVAQITQKDLTFLPSLLPVQVGTKVEFPNLDDTYHNIFSFSPPKRFDLGRYRSDERPIPSQVFDAAGLVTLRCDIHEHMRALILVLDTPHFVITGVDGSFRLANLPAGRYTLKAWVNSKTTRERTVELGADPVLRVDFP